MIGLPEVETCKPAGMSLSISEARVLPVRAKCPSKVPGGTLMLTATGVSAPIEAKVTYRVKYKTFDGDRQRANTYPVAAAVARCFTRRETEFTPRRLIAALLRCD